MLIFKYNIHINLQFYIIGIDNVMSLCLSDWIIILSRNNKILLRDEWLKFYFIWSVDKLIFNFIFISDKSCLND